MMEFDNGGSAVRKAMLEKHLFASAAVIELCIEPKMMTCVGSIMK